MIELTITPSETVNYNFMWGNYMWGYYTNKRLVGKPLIATRFKTRAKALRTCMKLKSCRGVNQLGM